MTRIPEKTEKSLLNPAGDRDAIPRRWCENWDPRGSLRGLWRAFLAKLVYEMACSAAAGKVDGDLDSDLVTLVTDARIAILYASRLLGGRTLNQFFSRRTFLEVLLVAGADSAIPARLSYRLRTRNNESAPPPKPAFPVADYHVHLSNTLTIEQAVQLGKDRGVQIGILEHPGPGFPINSDGDLERYIDGLRKYPVRVGLQPVYPG